ncbi:MAG TPA: DUF1573 domain-containing protein [Bacteroidia bacterium]|jgi:hypothetical protein|nr:DUF1573 domain-containing protein [Bacteroidia bacterium]
MKKLITSIALAMGLMFAHNTKAQQTDPNAPVISFANDTINYGTVARNAEGNRVFTFTNTGKEPLIIANVKQSCGCTTPKAWPTAPIQPGQTGIITVHYATDRVGQFIKTLTVTSNATASSKVIYIKGNVLPDAPTTASVNK